MNSLLVRHAASLWYPVMLAQTMGEISEAKAAELLGLNIEMYRLQRGTAVDAVMVLVKLLPSPLTSLLDVMRDRPDLLTPND